MRNLVYYVASSIDGYIMGPDENMGNFIGEGPGIEQYLADLQTFDTVVMGRKTYEFGYRFGLQPGQRAYPHMQHYIFSETLELPDAAPGVHVCPIEANIVRELKQQEGTDIYLCGGGQLAGWLFDEGLIDILKIKLNPLVLGAGVRLFGDSRKELITHLLDSQRYESGLHLITYQLTE